MTRVKNTITINGKVYDSVSGLPVAAPDPIERTAQPVASTPIEPVEKYSVSTKPHIPAKSVHRTTQKSQTLRRQTLKRPEKKHVEALRRKPQPGHVSTSPLISKFAPHPQPLVKTTATSPAIQSSSATAATHRSLSRQSMHHTSDIRPAARMQATPVARPVAHKTHVPHKDKPAALSSRELKQKLIAERLASVDTTKKHTEHKAPKQSLFRRTPRVSSALVASFAVVVLGGYLTYINMPNLSMRVAAASSGVDGSFPQYKPDGYRFNGPVAYSNGEINLNFASNTSQSGYKIKQKSSSWDSQAVLDNYVTKKTASYDTYSEQGLTIYTYGNNAAWVNGGTFYSIEGDAPLSNSQILRIASSM